MKSTSRREIAKCGTRIQGNGTRLARGVSWVRGAARLGRFPCDLARSRRLDKNAALETRRCSMSNSRMNDSETANHPRTNRYLSYGRGSPRRFPSQTRRFLHCCFHHCYCCSTLHRHHHHHLRRYHRDHCRHHFPRCCLPYDFASKPRVDLRFAVDEEFVVDSSAGSIAIVVALGDLSELYDDFDPGNSVARIARIECLVSLVVLLDQVDATTSL